LPAAYAESTASAVSPGDATSLAATALLNRENTLRVLDSAIAALHAIRNDIDGKDEVSLDERLTGLGKAATPGGKAAYHMSGSMMARRAPRSQTCRECSIVVRHWQEAKG